MIPVFLINLRRSSDRLQRMRERLDEISLPFRRIDAFDGGEMDSALRMRWTTCRPRCDGHLWSDGQIGCFISHFSAWKKIAKGADAHALILEDDMHVSEDMTEVCDKLHWMPPNADIVRLETTLHGVNVTHSNSPLHGARVVRRVNSNAWGAGAYIIARKTATHLCNCPTRQHLPVDSMLFNIKHSLVARSISTYQVDPALAIQDKYIEDHKRIGFPSLIEGVESASGARLRLRKVMVRYVRWAVGRRIIPFA